MNQLLQAPFQHTCQDVSDHYEVNPDEGLKKSQVEQRQETFGKNRLREAERRSTLSILIEQFKSLIVLLLFVASGLAFAFGDVIEGVAILAVIVINAAIGFFTELRAVRSMEALQQMGQVEARVRRDDQVQEIDATELVPGDILILNGGNVVTADARLIEAANLQADESPLTGESVPVDKDVKPLDEDTELAERANMVFKGTSITRGTGEAIVVATGMETEIGHISSLVESAEDETTPLEKRLDQLGQKLVWLTLAVALGVVMAGVMSGKELQLMIETAIALAVASIPEGLPIVATIALARGMSRMARRNALINRLSTVETLGATNIICTDKTGTLTENEMSVSGFQFEDEYVELKETDSLFPRLEKALRIGVLCNNAALNDENEGVGEPLEVALLEAGIQYDISRDRLLDELPEAREVAFSNETNMMATFHRNNGDYYVAVKGAPEAVLEACDRVYTDTENTRPLQDRDTWLQRDENLAGNGLRMLALAEKTASSAEDDPYQGLTFVGLVGLLDPPREDVSDAIADCQRAGVRVIMVTGDQPATARNIGQAVGLDNKPDVVRGKELAAVEDMSEDERAALRETAIFARVNPEQKLKIIELHQQNDKRVAMTGDGVNDAPALKKADIGIAMGQRGTQVAQETADMVLTDDALSSIVVAIRQGRIVFENIRQFVVYLLSCNLSEILIVGLASMVSAPLPITPLQILFLNLVTDVFPALALGVGEGDDSIMEQPPRDPQESIIRRFDWGRISFFSGLITASVLVTFAVALQNMSTERAVTIAFLTLAFAQLWNVFNMRDLHASFFDNAITRNLWVWGALALCTALLIFATYVPFMQIILNTTNPGLDGWLMILIGSVAPLVAGQIGMLIYQRMRMEN